MDTFVCDGTKAQKCSDRNNDGIFDAPITLIGRTDPFDTTVDKELILPRVQADYIVGTNYAGRLLEEQCDNGGVPDDEHGCDALGQIMTGWTCVNYHLKTIQNPDPETPIFASVCTPPAIRRNRRNLEDYDKHGRKLTHTPYFTDYKSLPSNDFRSRKHTLILDGENSNNG